MPPVDPDDVMTHPLLMDDKLRREWFAHMEQAFRAPRRYIPGMNGPIDDYYVRMPMCGAVVFYDEIQPDYDQDDWARIEYLKQITMECARDNTPHRTAQELRRERRIEQASRDYERGAAARRAQWQIPTRA